MNRLPGFFVTGTDTNVGKTYVASAIARGLTDQGRRVGVLKPVATGARRVAHALQCEDAERLIEAIGGGIASERVAPLVYEEPLAPSVAARRGGSVLEFDEVRGAVLTALQWWTDCAEVMIVEGIGGLLSPLAEAATVADLAVFLDYPLVVVARRGLGTLNHTLLTIEAARRRGLRVAGVVLNSPRPSDGSTAEETNGEELARLLEGVGVLAELGFQGDLGPSSIADVFAGWYDRARKPRASEQQGRIEDVGGGHGQEVGPR